MALTKGVFVKRPSFNQERDILILTDYPTADEVKQNSPWSASSHLEILSDLNKVGVKTTINIGTDQDLVLKHQIATSYLSYERPEEGNFDFVSSFSRKAIRRSDFEMAGESLSDSTKVYDFIPIPWEKSIYVREDLYAELQSLLEEIRRIKPKFIIVAGKWSLYFLSARVPYNKTQGTKVSKKPLGGLSSHRSSITACWDGCGLPDNIIIFPVLPASEKWRSLNEKRVRTEKALTICQWDWKKFAYIFNDVTAGGTPAKDYLSPAREYIFGTSLDIINEFFSALSSRLEEEETYVSVDIETRYGVIDCVGFSYIQNTALCVPLSTSDNPIPWTEEDERQIVELFRKTCTHKNFKGVFQNGAFDIQEISKTWGIEIKPGWDTMLVSHCFYNTQKKDLAFLASINCTKYSYWKDAQTHEEEELAK